MKKSLSMLLAGAMLVGTLAGCGGGSNAATTNNSGTEENTATGTVFKIGGTSPLTGDAAIYGNAVKNGAELAAQEINAEGGVANAIGSAISKVSGTYEKLINYDELPREQALAQAKADAVELAVEAGAIRETVEIIEVEDVPLAYYPGNTSRVKIKAAGDLRA